MWGCGCQTQTASAPTLDSDHYQLWGSRRRDSECSTLRKKNNHVDVNQWQQLSYLQHLSCICSCRNQPHRSPPPQTDRRCCGHFWADDGLRAPDRGGVKECEPTLKMAQLRSAFLVLYAINRSWPVTGWWLAPHARCPCRMGQRRLPSWYQAEERSRCHLQAWTVPGSAAWVYLHTHTHTHTQTLSCFTAKFIIFSV